MAFTKTFVMLFGRAAQHHLGAGAARPLAAGQGEERGRPPRVSHHHPAVRAVRVRRAAAADHHLAIGAFAIASAIPLYLRLGSEFMPPLNEGDLLYMPTTLPGISIEEAKRQLERQDACLPRSPK